MWGLQRKKTRQLYRPWTRNIRGGYVWRFENNTHNGELYHYLNIFEIFLLYRRISFNRNHKYGPWAWGVSVTRRSTQTLGQMPSVIPRVSLIERLQISSTSPVGTKTRWHSSRFQQSSYKKIRDRLINEEGEGNHVVIFLEKTAGFCEKDGETVCCDFEKQRICGVCFLWHSKQTIRHSKRHTVSEKNNY